MPAHMPRHPELASGVNALVIDGPMPLQNANVLGKYAKLFTAPVSSVNNNNNTTRNFSRELHLELP